MIVMESEQAIGTVLIGSLSDMRGFMTTHGQPDQSRSARYILKDYVIVS